MLRLLIRASYLITTDGLVTALWIAGFSLRTAAGTRL